ETASSTHREADTGQHVVRSMVEADAGADVDLEIRGDEIDEAADGVMTRAGRAAAGIERVPLDKALELPGELDDAGEAGGKLVVNLPHVVLDGVVGNEQLDAEQVLHHVPAHVHVDAGKHLPGAER